MAEGSCVNRAAVFLTSAAGFYGAVVGVPRCGWRRPADGPHALPARSTAAAAAKILRVPHLSGTIVLDSDTDDPGWTSPSGPARTGAFARDDGAPARPYSDVRLVWGDGHLYLALYAADQDIESVPDEPGRPMGLGDYFRLMFFREDDGEQLSIEVSPVGALSDTRRPRSGPVDLSWHSGAHVSHEIDGTLNDATDDDEEWVIEMAVPFESLGMTGRVGESIGFAVSRCDKPKNEERICTGWGDWNPLHGRAGSRLVLDRQTD